MPLSKKQRMMNKTFTVFTNQHYSSDNDVEQEQQENISPSWNDNRFATFTKCKIQPQDRARYFDSPTIITLDEDDDDRDIPVSRCSNKTSAVGAEPNLNETDLSDLLIFTNRKFVEI